MSKLYTFDGSVWREISKNGTNGSNGLNGTDGKEVEIRNNGTDIEWRYVGGTWQNLIAVASLVGAPGNNGTNGTDGKEVELQKTATHIQWRYVGGTWTNLVALTEITGPQGDPGEGLPIGGTTGQQLVKLSNADYDYNWQTPAGAGDMLKSVYDPTNINASAFARANHTGTQTASTISDFDTEVANNSAVTANSAKISFDSASSTKLAGIETGAEVNTVDSVAGKTGAVSLVKGDVGLGNVDNTSDVNKPVSTAQQTALDAKQATLVSGTNIRTINGNTLLGSTNLTTPNTTYTEITEAEITAGTASTLRTMTGRRAQFLANKAAAQVTTTTLGLNNVDNTSDATKNSATATLTNKTINGADNILSNIPTSAISNSYSDWTPSFTNFSLGNGTVNYARFSSVGGAVTFRIKITLGSTSSVTGRIQISLPVTAHGSYGSGTDAFADANVMLRDASASISVGTASAIFESSTVIGIGALGQSGGYGVFSSTSSTVPFAWAVNDIIKVEGTYEAA